MTISSWLTFGRPAPPGKGSAAGRKYGSALASAQCLRLCERFFIVSFVDRAWVRDCGEICISAITSRKCRTLGRRFSNAGSCRHTYQRPESTWLFVLFNSALLYFQFQFPHLVCFIAWPNVNWANLRLLIAYFDSWRQRGTSQHTVNANELRTKAVPGSRWSRVCISYVEYTVRESSLSVTNKHTLNFIYYE